MKVIVRQLVSMVNIFVIQKDAFQPINCATALSIVVMRLMKMAAIVPHLQKYHQHQHRQQHRCHREQPIMADTM